MRNDQLKLAVRAAIAAGALATAVAAPAAFAQEEAADLDRVQVTGTRIKRTDIEGALPVTVIDREAIDLSGENSVADLLRNTTFNSFGSFRPQSGSSGQAGAELSLRGLGGDRTLILIDGRRMPKGPMFGAATNDLNIIPLAAVERIEILSDGASAVYGSDAIGGVVNIVTRRDFEGMQVRGGVGIPKRDGGDTEEFSMVVGGSGGRGRVLAGVNYNHRDIFLSRDRPWFNQLGSVYSNNYADVIPTADGGLVADLPFLGSVALYTEDGSGCSGEFFRQDAFFCRFEFDPWGAANEAALTNLGLFVNADIDINMDWRVYTSARMTRVKSFGRYAPAPDDFVLDADSPNNLFGEPIGIWHRFIGFGPRDTTINSNVADMLLGFEGTSWGIDFDAGARITEYKYDDLGVNYLNRVVTQQYLNDGTYNIFDPYGNSQEVTDAMKVNITRDGLFRIREVYGTASRDLLDLPAGTVIGLIGGEWRKEEYRDQYDSLSEAGLVGGSAGNSSEGSRYVRAAFAELLVPVLPDLEFSFAGRYDQYSDYGGDFSPKVALRWQPFDELVFRASYGEGFRAPNLDILTQKDAFSADFVTDAQTCINLDIDPDSADCSVQVNAFRLAAPDLESENSEQFSLGVAYQPLEWFNGSLDYWNITVKNRVAFFGSQTVINRTASGDFLPPNAEVFRNEAGSIIRINTSWANEGKIDTAGFDLNLRTAFNLDAWGFLRNEIQVSRTNSYTINDGRNLVGDSGTPKYRGALRNTYQWSDFTFAYNVDYIHGTDRGARGTAAYVPNGVSSWTTHHVQGSWFAPWNAEVTLGVRNVGDKMPPLDNRTGRGYDMGLYDAYGRVVYVRYAQNF